MRDNLSKEHPHAFGFTLIEVMIVLAVIGILTVVTIPRFQSVQDHYRLEAAAQVVMNNIRQAKQLAMDQRNTVTVGLSNQKIKIFDLPEQNLNEGITFDEGRSIGLTLQAPWSCMSYDYHGFVIPGNPPGPGEPLENIQIVLTSLRTNQTVTIVVEAQTGNTTLHWS